ncbi:MAG: TIGR04563 family protein [Deltaproteobacteria bacterium]|nr:TIGR04563 family protein [Deltaproteobacteria bacterium]
MEDSSRCPRPISAESMLHDIKHESARLDRSLSWIVQRCVKIALPEIRKLPSVNDIPDTPEDSAKK